MPVKNGILAIGLATIIAIAGTGAAAAPVTATDPTPAPSAAPSDTPSPTVDPSATASPDPTVVPDPTVAPTPAPSSEPTAAPTAEPAPTATVEPVASATPAPSAAATTVATPKPVDRGLIVKRIALRQRWDRYVSGAIGPNAFDCSGLVRYAYNRAGVGRKLGGGHSARGMLLWGRLKGITSRRNPQIGDVVIYGNGRHAGIYIGKGYIISALNPRQDIKITRLHALGDPFTTFIHTRI